MVSKSKNKIIVRLRYQSYMFHMDTIVVCDSLILYRILPLICDLIQNSKMLVEWKEFYSSIPIMPTYN